MSFGNEVFIGCLSNPTVLSRPPPCLFIGVGGNSLPSKQTMIVVTIVRVGSVLPHCISVENGGPLPKEATTREKRKLRQ